MFQTSAAVTGFIGSTLYVWYWKNASLSFKSVLTILIATIFLGTTFTSGVWGDQTSLMIGVVIGFITAFFLG